MNIFVTSDSPLESAIWLDDKRANQLVRESLQLLSTTTRLSLGDNTPEGLYENFNPNHPCRLWTGLNLNNFVWLVRHTSLLLGRVPNDKHIRAREVFKVITDFDVVDRLKDKLRTIDYPMVFCNCAGNASKGVSFKHLKNVPLAYRMYLNARWKTDARPPTWRTGIKPDWAEV